MLPKKGESLDGMHPVQMLPKEGVHFFGEPQGRWWPVVTWCALECTSIGTKLMR